MLSVLDILAVPDTRTDGDFWREQNFVDVPKVWRPESFHDILPEAGDSLRGKRIAVPKMFVGGTDPKAKAVVTSQDVIDLWNRARHDLEALGATVIESDFPLVTNYEDESISGQANNVQGFKPDWNAKERGELVAYLWDDFLKTGGDPKFSGGLSTVDGTQMFPRPDDLIPDRYMERKNFMNYPALVEMARNRNGKSIWEIDGITEALPALEAQRKRDFEDWMDADGYDVVVFPANGDIGKADVDENDESAKHALQNGVRYSNGNRAIRHMGVPTVSVCMGLMAKLKMPVNLTFAGKHGQDADLLKYAYAFEEHTKRRTKPPVTPALPSDTFNIRKGRVVAHQPSDSVPNLKNISVTKVAANKIRIAGSTDVASHPDIYLEVFIDGNLVTDSKISWSDDQWSVDTEVTPFEPPKPLYVGVGQVVGNFNIVVLARSGGQVRGKMIMVPQNSVLE